MNKYLITGSLGNISKGIVEGLIAKGHEVAVITSSKDRVAAIEKLGAKALVGHLQDQAFLNAAFKNAEVVYTMIPPIWQTDNWRKSQDDVAKAYLEALKGSAVKYVVNLSSVGAHLPNGVGPVNAIHAFEKQLNGLKGVQVKHLRPAYFFHNFLAQIGLIQHAGIMGGNFGDKEKLFLVHPSDIATAALDELLTLSFSGNSVRYVISDERSGDELAKVLGKAIGKDLNWVVFTDEDQKAGLLQAGLPETHAAAFTEMGHALNNGSMQADARAQKPSFGTTKLEQFAAEFAAAFKA